MCFQGIPAGVGGWENGKTWERKGGREDLRDPLEMVSKRERR